MTRCLILLCGLLLALPSVGATKPAALLWEVGAERAWPDLVTMSWRPDLLLRGDLPVMERAVAVLRQAVDAEPGTGPFWVRLDAFDLCQVGDCETCQPPSADPYALRAAGPLDELTPDHLRFIALATAALAETRARPYVVVPPLGRPTLLTPLTGLVALLEPPRESASTQGRTTTQVAELRTAQAAAWRTAGAEPWHLVRDGWDQATGLPLGADLLRARAAGLEPALLVARDERHATAPLPAWLATAFRQPLTATPLGDTWRADDPGLARLADLLAPLVDELAAHTEPEARLAALTLAALQGSVNDGPGLAETLAAQAAAADALGLARPATGPLSAAWQAWVESGARPPSLALPRLTGVVADGERRTGEWAAAARVELRGDDVGAANPRPATAWLGHDGAALVVAVEATEPNPAEASPRDWLRVWLAGPDPAGPRVWVGAEVGGRLEAWRLAAPGAEPQRLNLSGARSTGVFDGPGWSLELRLPWAALGFDTPPTQLNLATEQRRGAYVNQTFWQPTYGASWLPPRWATLTRQ